MKARYITTMDFEFKNVDILNANTEEELMNKIKENEIIKIKNENDIEYINSSYIQYYELEKVNDVPIQNYNKYFRIEDIEKNNNHIPRID